MKNDISFGLVEAHRAELAECAKRLGVEAYFVVGGGRVRRADWVVDWEAFGDVFSEEER